VISRTEFIVLSAIKKQYWDGEGAFVRDGIPWAGFHQYHLHYEVHN